MTVSWRHRIVRVPEGDERLEQDALIQAVAEGWIFASRAHGEGETVDLVFRRAEAKEQRPSWF